MFVEDKNNFNSNFWIFVNFWNGINRGRRGCDRMVVVFIAIYAISVYHH
jgi:hypothetical protein